MIAGLARHVVLLTHISSRSDYKNKLGNNCRSRRFSHCVFSLAPPTKRACYHGELPCTVQYVCYQLPACDTGDWLLGGGTPGIAPWTRSVRITYVWIMTAATAVLKLDDKQEI